MPALVQKGYDDDGVYYWKCSDCDFGVAMRGDGIPWKQCPACGVEYTHNEIANSSKANDVRYEREGAKYRPRRKKGPRYTVTAWTSNAGRKYYGAGYLHLLDEEMWDAKSTVPEWLSVNDSPEPFRLEKWEDLSPSDVRRLINQFHGYPKTVVLQQ
jgi:hypothetical protein